MPQFGKIGRVGRPARLGLRGDPVKPGPDSRALISPLVPCIGLWLAVTLAAYCSPSRWSHDGAEKNSKKYKIGQSGAHCKLQNCG